MNQENPFNRFTKEQRSRLTKLGLCKEQVACLENGALIIGMATFMPKAGMAEVRAELTGLKKSASKAIKSLMIFSSMDTSILARREAINRIRIKEYQSHAGENRHELWDNGCIPKGIEQLKHIVSVIDSALKEIPPNLRRPSIGTQVIGEIDKDLVRGFNEHQQRFNPTGPLLPYEIRVTATEGGQFHSIASICFEALGHSADPRGAIEAYLRETRSRRARQAQALYGGELEKPKRGRPLKSQLRLPKYLG